MMRRALWVLGGLAWGVLSFGIGLYATFPAEAAKDRIEYEFTKATGDEYAVDIAGLSLWRMSGVNMKGVDVYSLKKGHRTKDDPKPPMERTKLASFDDLGVRLALLPLLTGKKAVAFDTDLAGGSVTGTYAQGSSSVDLAFDVSDLDLSQLPTETAETKIALLGKLQAEADLTLDTEDTKASTGTIRFSLPGFGLGSGSSVGGFQLPEVTFDKAEVAFEAKDGKLEVTEGTFESSTLNATLSGDITLNKKLARSRNRLELTFSLPEDLDQLAQLAPDVKRSRDSDGKYHYLISGTVMSPHGRFSRAGVHAPRGSDDEGPASPVLGGALRGGGAADFDPGMTDEERKEARRKRIEERRERLRKRREEREAGNADGMRGKDGNEKGDDGPPFLPGDDGPQMDEPMPGMDDGPDQPQFPPPDEGPPGQLGDDPGGE